MLKFCANLKSTATALGFDEIGWTPANQPEDYGYFTTWLEEEKHAGMHYLEKQSLARKNPESILVGVKTVIMVLMSYQPATPDSTLPAGLGKVARYARGPDYHHVLWERLAKLGQLVEEHNPDALWRAISDSAPLLERGFANRAGMGWIGKNTLLIHRKLGSFTVLGALLVSIEFPSMANPIIVPDSCGSCTRCIDACPTNALDHAHTLDARKCISYWTIEHRGPLGKSAGSQLNNCLFGCDICQEVCPWNKKNYSGIALGQHPELASLSCVELLGLTDQELREKIRKTSILRAKIEGIRRNALWILGSQGHSSHLGIVEKYLSSTIPALAEAASWARDQISSKGANPGSLKTILDVTSPTNLHRIQEHM